MGGGGAVMTYVYVTGLLTWRCYFFYLHMCAWGDSLCVCGTHKYVAVLVRVSDGDRVVFALVLVLLIRLSGSFFRLRIT